jgi:hypothetical protein
MIRISKWSGLVTTASPYILPSGGAVEQINAQSITPGQLSARGGMAHIDAECAFQVPAPGEEGAPELAGLIELWGYSPGSGDTEIIFGFTDDGNIVKFTNISAVE